MNLLVTGGNAQQLDIPINIQVSKDPAVADRIGLLINPLFDSSEPQVLNIGAGGIRFGPSPDDAFDFLSLVILDMDIDL